MNPLLLPIALLGLGLAVVLGSRPRRRAPSLPSMTQQDCAPLPWLSEDVDEAIRAGLEAGICQDSDELAAVVADVVYPQDDQGVPIPWPREMPWHVAASDTVQCIWERIRVRAAARLATWADAHCPGAEPADLPGLVGAWESTPPRCGRFYQVRAFGESEWTEHETIPRIARECLRAEYVEVGHDPSIVDEVDRRGVKFRIIRMANLIEETNNAVYGSPVAQLGTDRNPGVGHWSTTGRGVSVNRVHADNRGRMATGREVRRSVVVGGRADGKNARHDGTGGHPPFLLIPPLDRGRLAESPNDVVPGRWPDGSSGAEPPLEFRSFFNQGAA